MCLESVWKKSGSYLKGVWKMAGGVMEGACRVSGIKTLTCFYRKERLHVSRGCLEGVWKVSEECMLGIQMVSRQYKYGFYRVKKGWLNGLKNSFQF